jgi:hypothetical protein
VVVVELGQFQLGYRFGVMKNGAGQCYTTFYGRKLRLFFQVVHSRLLVSPTNIRIGWKGLPGTNDLAY